MERRNLLAGLAVLALSLFMLSGTAFAHVAHHKRAKPRETAARPRRKRAWCTRCPTRSWTRVSSATSSSVADIIEVECEEVYAEQYVRISANELYSRCEQSLYWRTPYVRKARGHGSELPGAARQRRQRHGDRVGGPSCAAGESLISAHLESAPYTTATTGFTVLPPRPTPPGVFATPESKVEGEDYSDVATIVQVEFPPVFAEEPVNVQRLAAATRAATTRRTSNGSCDGPTRVHPLDPAGERRLHVYLDNDGNAFVVLVGNSSCAAGTSLIEASLENAPYTTYTTEFTIEPPQPTFPN